MKEITLAPNLSVSVEWSREMTEVWRTRYLEVWMGRPCDDEQLCREFNQWQQRLNACYWHIERFFKLTGSLPVVGDLFLILEEEGNWKCPDLRIESRTIFTCLGDNSLLVTYGVQSRHMEWLKPQSDRAEKELVSA